MTHAGELGRTGDRGAAALQPGTAGTASWSAAVEEAAALLSGALDAGASCWWSATAAARRTPGTSPPSSWGGASSSGPLRRAGARRQCLAAITAVANDYGFEGLRPAGPGVRQAWRCRHRDQHERRVRRTCWPGCERRAGATCTRSASRRSARGAGMGRVGGRRPDRRALRESTPRIQEAHALIAHLLCELVERRWS